MEQVFRPAFEQVSIQGLLGPEPGFRGRRKGPELPRSPALRFFYRCTRINPVTEDHPSQPRAAALHYDLFMRANSAKWIVDIVDRMDIVD